ncbi:hypothetical protein K3495_g9034 [Podosphaera aphanis]|nr:hypothetical protein K3495_g9034 [Podosphaera aphanis]
MSYRVEVSSSGRAGCQSSDCKKAGNKIPKNELRLGTWVDIPDRGGSWRWRHWGCVTGKILQNIRNALDPSESGDYSWDALDGYQGEEKSSLEHYPDLQEKVRRVITQGFIDHNDFNGDPEMNKLGCSGLHVPVSRKKNLKKDNDDSLDIDDLKKQLNALAAERNSVLENGGALSKIDAQLAIVQQALIDIEQAKNPNKKKPTAKKSASKKRGRKNDNLDNEELTEEEIEMPVKKKRISAKDRIKMEAESKGIEENVEIPAKKKQISAKSRIKMEAESREIKDEEEENVEIPAKKKRISAKDRLKIVAERGIKDEEENVEIPAKKKQISAKSRIKMEAESREIKDEEEKVEIPAKKKRVSPKDRIKMEEVKDENVEEVGNEPSCSHRSTGLEETIFRKPIIKEDSEKFDDFSKGDQITTIADASLGKKNSDCYPSKVYGRSASAPEETDDEEVKPALTRKTRSKKSH